MTSPRQRTLLLPKAAPKARRVFRQRRRRARWQQLGTGLLSLAGGAGLMFGLMLLPERLDTLLLVSNAIANLIGGLSRFGMGLPSASISQCRRVEVWTWQGDITRPFYTFLDLEDIEKQRAIAFKNGGTDAHSSHK